MRAVVVVVVAPCRNQVTGMAQAGEQVLVEAFVQQTTVEALDEAVLHRFAGRDVVPFDLSVLLPREDCIRRQLCPVVACHHAGIATQLGDAVEFPGHAMARDRRVDDGTKALSAEVVDDAQHPETATPDKAVSHKVEGPALVRPLRDRNWRTGSKGPLSPATFAHRQPLFAIDAVELLPVHVPTLPFKQDAQAAIAKAATFGRQFAQSAS